MHLAGKELSWIQAHVLPPARLQVLAERQLQLLDLFSPALGPEAAAHLEEQYNSNAVSSS